MTNETTRALAEADAAIRRIKRRTTRSQTVRGVTLGPIGPAREPLIAADLDAGFEATDGTRRRRPREAVAVRRSGRVLAMLPFHARAAANHLAGLVERAAAPNAAATPGTLAGSPTTAPDRGVVRRVAMLEEVRDIARWIGDGRIVDGRVPVLALIWLVVVREATLLDALRDLGVAKPRRRDLVEARDALVAALDRVAGRLVERNEFN